MNTKNPFGMHYMMNFIEHCPTSCQQGPKPWCVSVDLTVPQSKLFLGSAFLVNILHMALEAPCPGLGCARLPSERPLWGGFHLVSFPLKVDTPREFGEYIIVVPFCARPFDVEPQTLSVKHE